jgi:DNA-binding response OmpR family regulator
MSMLLGREVRRIAEPAEMAEVRLLLIETDDLLLADIAGLGHSEIVAETLSSAEAVEPVSLAGRCDVLVINIDMPGGFELLEKVCRMRIGPPVIALAGHGVQGRTLEHVLILAELRGAAMALPKPIDADELALASLRVLERERPATRQLSALAEQLERRLAV